MKEFYKKNKAILIFLLRAAGIYFIWFIVYNGWIYKNGSVDNFLIQHIITVTAFTLKTLGFVIFIDGHSIGIVNSSGLVVSQPCNGISLFALFAGFIIAYPGNLKSKLLFIPVGILLIHLINLVRIILLVLIVNYSPQSLEFNHSYTFTFLIYLFIFLMWMWWIGKGTRK